MPLVLDDFARRKEFSSGTTFLLGQSKFFEEQLVYQANFVDLSLQAELAAPFLAPLMHEDTRFFIQKRGKQVSTLPYLHSADALLIRHSDDGCLIIYCYRVYLKFATANDDFWDSQAQAYLVGCQVDDRVDEFVVDLRDVWALVGRVFIKELEDLFDYFAFYLASLVDL